MANAGGALFFVVCMPKIIIAPDSFKETLSAPQVAAMIAAALRTELPQAQLVQLPLADGGEGTLTTLLEACGGRLEQAQVRGPLGQPVLAHWGVLGDGQTAVIEIATACGLALLAPHERNPLLTSSEGVGDLIRAALDQGIRRFILALGGSATNDGGSGMLRALGAQLLGLDGQPLPPGGAALARLAQIDLSGLDARLLECEFELACDVENPLTGPRGASAVFGPQKGASPAQVVQLDEALHQFAHVIRRQLGKDVETLPGGGAAGGIGAAALAFLFNCRLRRGIDIVLEAVQLTQALQGAALVITGEGCLDAQTLAGKAPFGVAQLAQQAGVPVLAIVGALQASPRELEAAGILAAFDCIPALASRDEVLLQAEANLTRTAQQVARLLRLGMWLKD